MAPNAPEVTARSRDGRTFTFRTTGTMTYAPGDMVVVHAAEATVLGQVLEAVAALRRQSCTLHVRLNAGLDDRVADLVAGVPDADVTTVTRPLWVDRPLAAVSPDGSRVVQAR